MRTDILDVRTDAQRFDEAIETLLQWAVAPQKRYVCTCPVYTLMLATEQPPLKAALNQADMVTADGMPIVWVQRRLGYPQAERVYGPDVMTALCHASAGRGIRHFLWGGMPGVPEKLAQMLQTQAPGLEIAGTYSPPIAPVGNKPDPETVERLNAANPHVIWVGLGSPKQDHWLSLYRPVLNAPLLIAVGAAFDFLSGTKKQAPRWMQRSGLEWAFRFAQEPGRLWQRYVIYNPRFVWQVWRKHF